METKTYITLSRLAALLLLLSCGISLPAQTVNYTYDNAGNRTGRTVSPAANAAPSPVAFSVDTAMLRQAASARQLAPDRRRRAASVRESLAGKAIGKHSDAVSEAMEREHEERIAKWIAACDGARPAEQKSRASGDAAGGDRALSFSSSTPVVNIPLQEGVSPTGARTYSIPIPTAYGFPYAPAVSLSYNSQAGMGLAGYGWTVSGLSAITIANKTLYYHGVAAAAKAGDPSGAFALDGEPLVPDPEVVIVGKIMRHVLLVFLFENNDVMIFGIDSNPNKDGVSVRRVKVEDLLFGSDFSSYQRYSAKQLKERSQRSKEFYRIFTSINPLFFEKTNKDKIIILDNFILRNSQYFVESP